MRKSPEPWVIEIEKFQIRKILFQKACCGVDSRVGEFQQSGWYQVGVKNFSGPFWFSWLVVEFYLEGVLGSNPSPNFFQSTFWLLVVIA